ncbi:MAG: hypothetical protein HYW95_00810 [Candidatus Wildermuthbacteria bacterium]|nr:hypothetical protein [Candidatus Wildermuthbacteria bacterium]
MKIFEFYFNPKQEKDRLLATFSFEPKSAKERKRGNMYFVGEIQNALPSHARLLKQLALVIRKEYYSFSFSATKKEKNKIHIEQALQAALKEANEFLRTETKNGNVHWLGNIHIAVLVILPEGESNYLFYFATCGTMNIWIARHGQLTDVGKTLEHTKDDDPLKVFGGIAIGKIMPRDRVLVFTRETFHVFSKEKLSKELIQLGTEKQLKQFFQKKEKKLKSAKGILLFLIAEDIFFAKAEAQKKKRHGPLFAWNEKLKFLQLKEKVRFSFHSPVRLSGRQKILLALPLILLLFAGIVRWQFNGSSEAPQTKEIRSQLEKYLQDADNAMIFKDQEYAMGLFKQAQQLLDSYKRDNGVLPAELASYEEKIIGKIYGFYLIEEMSNAQVFFQVPDSASVYSNIIFQPPYLYLYSKETSQMGVISLSDQTFRQVALEAKMLEGIPFHGTALFFAEPNILLQFNGDSLIKKVALELPESPFQLGAMAEYESALYMINSLSGSIIKYENPLKGNAKPIAWLRFSTQEKPRGAVLLAIDAHLWIVISPYTLQQYYKGEYRKEIQIDTFPVLENISGIIAKKDLPHLYLLEKAKKRILVLSKTGEMIKQIHGEQFRDLKDIAVSDDGQSLYLFDSATIYRIPITR